MASKVLQGDPRRPAEVKKFVKPPPAVSIATDGMLLGALVCGMVGMLLKKPISSWIAMFLCLSALANARAESTDYKQMMSAFTPPPDAQPLVGNLAPDFTATAVVGQDFQEITLSQYRGQYVILYFYPLDFTFVCPTEITAFSDRHAEFAKLNTEILGVSVDSQFAHLAWVQMDRHQGGLGQLAYPLVSDLRRHISTKYGVLSGEGVALRGLFIIDREGVIQHATINNLAFGRSVDETLRTLQAVQHVQAHPDQVCPAGWQPGGKTMKPDPKGSKEYFAGI